jgi:hypothetical protein
MLIHGHIVEVDGDQATMAALVELFVVLPGDDPKAGRTAIENRAEYHSTLRRAPADSGRSSIFRSFWTPTRAEPPTECSQTDRSLDHSSPIASDHERRT